MTASNQQVVTCYDELSMTIEEIAAEMQWEPTAVKMILAQSSPKFRAELGTKPKDGWTDEELERVDEVIFNLAVYGEDENLQFKAARYIRDDKKGRLDPKNLKSLNINITQVNVRMEKARIAMQRARESKVLVERGVQEIIDVTPTAVQSAA